jgi:hypothetical protein
MNANKNTDAVITTDPDVFDDSTDGEKSPITDEARSEFFNLAHYYCGDCCEYEGKYDEPPKPCPYEDDCEECPLHGFLTWLDTQ